MPQVYFTIWKVKFQVDTLGSHDSEPSAYMIIRQAKSSRTLQVI